MNHLTRAARRRHTAARWAAFMDLALYSPAVLLGVFAVITAAVVAVSWLWGWV